MAGPDVQRTVESTNTTGSAERPHEFADQAFDRTQQQGEDLLGRGLSSCNAVEGCNKEIVQSTWEATSRRATDAIAKDPKSAASFAKLLQEHVATSDPSFFRVTENPWADFNNAMTRLSEDRSESVAKGLWNGVLGLAQQKDKKLYARLQPLVSTL